MAEPKRAFVTGSSGFIGQHLVGKLLKSNLEAVYLYDLKEGKDILNYPLLVSSMRDADVVIHLAAKKSVPKSWDDYEKFYETNITGTHNVLRAAFNRGVKKVIVISSSSAEYAISPYGISKRASEDVAKAFSNIGLDIVCLRLFNVFGPGQPANDAYSAVVPNFITAFLDGKKPIVHGDGKQMRDFTYVEDVCEAIMYSISSENVGKNIYDVGYGNSGSILDLLRVISELVGVKPEFKVGARRQGDIDLSIAINRLPGWNPSVGFGEGLRRTVKWYKNELSLSHRI